MTKRYMEVGEEDMDIASPSPGMVKAWQKTPATMEKRQRKFDAKRGHRQTDKRPQLNVRSEAGADTGEHPTG